MHACEHGKGSSHQGRAGGQLALITGVPAAVKRHRQGPDAGQCGQGGLCSAVHLQEVLLQRLKVANAELPAGHPQQSADMCRKCTTGNLLSTHPHGSWDVPAAM